MLAINSFATNGKLPDVTFYMDIEPEIGLARIAAGQGREINRLDLEGIDFHHQVREGYQMVARKYPDRIRIIDASGSKEEVALRIKTELAAALKDFDLSLSNS
ncbi:Thymidylate kinase [compost metagenome]